MIGSMRSSLLYQIAVAQEILGDFARFLAVGFNGVVHFCHILIADRADEFFQLVAELGMRIQHIIAGRS